MITLLGTFPAESSGNVGDKLITESGKRILARETGETDFLVLFREEDLTPHLEQINRSRAVAMPGFAIRPGMFPNLYRLVDDLTRIRAPLVPMGAGWSLFPGDFESARQFTYDNATLQFLHRIAAQNQVFACRDVMTIEVLKKHGIKNAKLVGDCAWYDLEALGRPMLRPDPPQKVVFTTPHMVECLPQAKGVLDTMKSLFPKAERFCCVHSRVRDEDKELLSHAENLGFRIEQMHSNLDSLSLYDECDLHVGYRVHGHISFFRRRRPSVLINEDGRGIGCSRTFGIGGFDAFRRNFSVNVCGPRTFLVRAMAKCLEMRIPPAPQLLSRTSLNMTVVDEVRAFLEQELESRFRKYIGIADYIDRTYEEAMAPFVRETFGC